MKQVPEWIQSKDLLDYPTVEQVLYWEEDSGSGKGLKERQISRIRESCQGINNISLT